MGELSPHLLCRISRTFSYTVATYPRADYATLSTKNPAAAAFVLEHSRWLPTLAGASSRYVVLGTSHISWRRHAPIHMRSLLQTLF